MHETCENHMICAFLRPLQGERTKKSARLQDDRATNNDDKNDDAHDDNNDDTHDDKHVYKTKKI